jgi:hypothetical protein
MIEGTYKNMIIQSRSLFLLQHGEKIDKKIKRICTYTSQVGINQRRLIVDKE